MRETETDSGRDGGGEQHPAFCRVRHDSFVRFARVHLRTRAERAAYAVLAGAPDEVWTAEDVAEAVRLDPHEMDRTLRWFAAAGIVEAVRAERTVPGYRWRSSMSYLFGPAGPAVETDPVCGMPVEPDGAYALMVGATTISFCSRRCLLLYQSGSGRPLPAPRPDEHP